MGCVRPPREGELGGVPPLSPKKRLRFRRKHKGHKNRRGESGPEDEPKRGNEPDDEEDDLEEKATVHLNPRTTQRNDSITVPDIQLTHSRMNPHSNTLSPSSVSTTVGGFLSSRKLEVSPKPSPAWRGVFCLPGEEDSVSAIIDVSSIHSQTTTTTPVNTAPTLGSTTPGGGRVYRVREKVQGVLEKPWILRQRREKKDKGRADREEKEHGEGKGEQEGTAPDVETRSERERKGVVHIREVDGKLCVVRTVYPSDYGSPVWSGQGDGDVEVHQEPPSLSPVTGVQLSGEDKATANIPAGHFHMSSSQFQVQDSDITAKTLRFDSPSCARDRSSFLESGYASDLPLTSPETAGTTPSQTDWGGLTSSSSERLDSMVESPESLQQLVTVRYLPQVCVLRSTKSLSYLPLHYSRCKMSVNSWG